LGQQCEKVADFFVRPQGHVVATLYIIEAFLRRGAEPFEFGFIFLLALLQEP